jgi:hypothetical protein
MKHSYPSIFDPEFEIHHTSLEICKNFIPGYAVQTLAELAIFFYKESEYEMKDFNKHPLFRIYSEFVYSNFHYCITIKMCDYFGKLTNQELILSDPKINTHPDYEDTIIFRSEINGILGYVITTFDLEKIKSEFAKINNNVSNHSIYELKLKIETNSCIEALLINPFYGVEITELSLMEIIRPISERNILTQPKFYNTKESVHKQLHRKCI